MYYSIPSEIALSFTMLFFPTFLICSYKLILEKEEIFQVLHKFNWV